MAKKKKALKLDQVMLYGLCGFFTALFVSFPFFCMMIVESNHKFSEDMMEQKASVEIMKKIMYNHVHPDSNGYLTKKAILSEEDAAESMREIMLQNGFWLLKENINGYRDKNKGI